MSNHAIVFPNAKINIGLHVTNRRSDGFHNIESIMVPVTLYDALEIKLSDNNASNFYASGLPIPHNQHKNLCLKAYDIIQQHLFQNSQKNILPPVNMHLLKGIPACAGLAGGSADAAFTLKILDKICNINMTTEVLSGLAAQLGSDCPFFVHNKIMYAGGRGEILHETGYCAELKELHIIISVPPVNIVTKEAFKLITPKKPKQNISEIIKKDIDTWQHVLINDFEKPIFRKYPIIGSIKQKMLDAGARYASLSGSGSAVFGLFNHLSSLEYLRNEFPSFKTFAVRPIV